MRDRMWMATCRECGPGRIVVSFKNRQRRDRWAVEHAVHLGHSVSVYWRWAPEPVVYEPGPVPL